MNENLVAIIVAILAVVATVVGVDDGSIIKLVVSAYLGFLIGKRRGDNRCDDCPLDSEPDS